MELYGTKKYPPTTLIRSPNIDFLYSGFLASQIWRARMALRTRYKKLFSKEKDIEKLLEGTKI
jgi:hypothetical protein